ncbi:thiopeptide-type bacteriocin biosynthesis protein [Streptomyces sp. NPDC005549]|uniref:thiopeptide-type bacteriocin biosynthesis protein n=1 Tax=Streptomyces sp. NPDC005549 TaxID=3154888 RepID=UPI0033A421AA
MSTRHWCQANVAFANWEEAETTAISRITPLLRAAESDGALSAWFIIRKHPCWRVRYQSTAAGQERIGTVLDGLTAEGHIKSWTEIIYEPERHAFGGDDAMASAHRFFHHDTLGLIGFLGSDAARYRRETSLMLCGLMMRSAQLDWYEQGDVWARVAAHRPQSPQPASPRGGRLHDAVHRLLRVDPHYAMQPGGPLAHAAEWARAYIEAGNELAVLNESGRLHRGLRDVLAHHVFFAWNRLGLPYTTQATLTAAARSVIFGQDPATERNAAAHVEAS